MYARSCELKLWTRQRSAFGWEGRAQVIDVKRDSTRLSDTEAAIRWLRQFEAGDQNDAVALIDAMVLVNHADFTSRLRELVIKRARSVRGRIALYAEREIRKRGKTPEPLFEESLKKGPRHAFGPGPAPVQMKRGSAEVGSEGLIAQFITELCREYPSDFFNHPGPDKIRKNAIRAFVLITDFIGSGRRSKLYLDAAWQVASVRSWWSYKLLQFQVLAYSATDEGRATLKEHPCRPTVEIVVPCPTIATEFKQPVANRMREMCVRLDPIDRDSKEALGFGGAGALIAFAHGCPNNAPRILHKKTKDWLPLFPGRATAQTRAIFGDLRNLETLKKRLTRLGEKRLARGEWIRRTSHEGRLMILFLAAARTSPRFDEALARKTGLTIPELNALVANASKSGWIDSERRLTDTGFGQLKHARALRSIVPVLPADPEDPYYPKSLRPPVR